METASIVENKELLNLYCRLLNLEKLVAAYKDNVKALKICLKLICTELDTVKKSKAPISSTNLSAIQWKYNDFAEIVKRLSKGSKAELVSKASADLDAIIASTETEIKQIEEKLNPPQEGNFSKITSTIGSTAQKFSKKIETGAQKLGDKISETVNGTVDEIKKRIAGDEN